MNHPVETKEPKEQYGTASLKVLHLIAVNEIGGAERLLTTLLPALQATGVAVECLILSRPAAVPKAKDIGHELLRCGIPVLYAQYTSVLKKQTLDFIAHTIKRQTPQLVHAHLKHAEIWTAILKRRRKITVPVISTLHGYRDDYHSRFGLNWQGRAKLSGYYWVNRFIGRQLDGFVSISQGVTDLFVASGLLNKERIATIHHGTKAGEPPQPENRQPRPDLVIVGRLVKFKGHQYAVGAVRLLKEKHPGVHLHLYGKGPEETALKALVKAQGLEANVTFHGFVQDVQAALPQHSIALVPSVGEPFGLVFFDAFKAGLPVVAFNVPAGNEIITHEVNGLLAATVSRESMAQEIEKLLENEGLYQTMAAKAYQTMKTDFSIERMAAAYASFYQRIINGKKPYPRT